MYYFYDSVTSCKFIAKEVIFLVKFLNWFFNRKIVDKKSHIIVIKCKICSYKIVILERESFLFAIASKTWKLGFNCSQYDSN